MLVVPIQMQILCISKKGESKDRVQHFSKPVASFDVTLHAEDDKRYLSEASLSDPFEHADAVQPGFHLHWFLPQALSHAEENTDQEAEQTVASAETPSPFPVVPNRWLVTRIIDDGCGSPQFRSWIVERTSC